MSSDINSHFELDDKEENLELTYTIKILEKKIIDAIIETFCSKIKDKELSEKLKIKMIEWQELNMLKLCLIDFLATQKEHAWQRALWNMIVNFFIDF